MSNPTVLAYLPSPPQAVWHLGPVPIRAYALCIIVGIIVAVWWGDRRWRARGGQPGEVLDVAIWAVPFGLIGGRIYHVLTDWPRYFGENGRGFSGAIAIWDGGLGIWGAVLFGALGAWIGCRFHGIKLPPFGDAIAPAILLAQAIGRLGNYFNQELFGGPTTLPWGLQIFQRVDADGYVGCTSLANDHCYLMEGSSNGVVLGVVHPTFLYELVWNVLVVIALVLIDRQFRIGHGRLFALYVAGYCIGRFGVELLRTDPATHILGLRINLFTAAIVFLCAALYFVMAPKGRESGLEVYWPGRAEELAASGQLGYVEPALPAEAAAGVAAATVAAPAALGTASQWEPLDEARIEEDLEDARIEDDLPEDEALDEVADLELSDDELADELLVADVSAEDVQAADVQAPDEDKVVQDEIAQEAASDLEHEDAAPEELAPDELAPDEAVIVETPVVLNSGTDAGGIEIRKATSDEANSSMVVVNAAGPSTPAVEESVAAEESVVAEEPGAADEQGAHDELADDDAPAADEPVADGDNKDAVEPAGEESGRSD